MNPSSCSGLLTICNLLAVVGQNSIRRSRPSGESRCAQSMAFLDVTGDVTGAMRKRWPARRDQAPIALPGSSPVTEGLGPGPVYLTPKD